MWNVKEAGVSGHQQGDARDLIETLWNVKLEILQKIRDAWMDLIETLWNVKYILNAIPVSSGGDLIETLWNVKDSYNRNRAGNSAGFNRDIVECKGERAAGAQVAYEI